MNRHPRRFPLLRRDRQAGQALAEFAVMMPAFLFVVFGLVEMGRLVYTNSALAQAAREGARVAAAEAAWVGVPGAGCVADDSLIGSGNPGAHVCPVDVPALRTHVAEAVNGMAVGLDMLDDLHLSCNTGTEFDLPPSGAWSDASDGAGNGCDDDTGDATSSAGDYVSVRVVYVYDPWVPVIGDFIGPITLSGAATMSIH